MTWLLRWMLFRVMFGAGLIKLRGDPCWRDLTCLDYYFETQPMPNPLSWYFHWLPASVHHGGRRDQPRRRARRPVRSTSRRSRSPAIAGLITIVFQLILIVSGNLSWLNWLTIVLAFATLDDRWLAWLPIRAADAAAANPARRRTTLYALAVLVGAAQHRADAEHALARAR